MDSSVSATPPTGSILARRMARETRQTSCSSRGSMQRGCSMKPRSLAAHIYEETVVYALELAGCPTQLSRIADEIWIDFDTGPIGAFFAGQPSRPRFEELLRQGNVGLLAVREGEWLAYGWLAPRSGRHPEHLPASATGLRWIHNCHTAPGYRGRGLYRQTLLNLVARAADIQRSRRLFIYTEPGNIRARIAIGHLPFEPAGTIRSIRLPRTKCRVGSRRRSRVHDQLQRAPR